MGILHQLIAGLSRGPNTKEKKQKKQKKKKKRNEAIKKN